MDGMVSKHAYLNSLTTVKFEKKNIYIYISVSQLSDING